MSDDLAGTLAAQLDRAAQKKLGRSLALYALAAGDCGGCALEVRALRATAYRLEALGLNFVAAPRHADVLLVTGAMTRTLADPVRHAWLDAADPKWVIAVGDCAAHGGLFKRSYAVLGGVAAAIPVDVVVSGCPPAPADVMQALIALLQANS